MSYNIEDAVEELKSLSIDTPQKPDLPDDWLLDKYEERIGFCFPDEYRTFLKQASDVFVGTLSPLTVSENSDGPGELAIALSQARTVGLPADWLPICEDNGDYYCLVDEGKIRFWSHDGASSESWPDLATWIKKVWIDEG